MNNEPARSPAVPEGKMEEREQEILLNQGAKQGNWTSGRHELSEIKEM